LLECVIKESMRVLPSVVYNTRNSTEPFELGPYHLPSGTTVGFSNYITHHMPELYPQPEKFLPQRWLSTTPSPYEYLPFGAGPRICIGATFAMMMLKISLAMIVQRYRLTVAPGSRIDRKVTVTLSPKYGVPMRIGPPDRQFAKSEVRGNIHEMVDLG
jgi:cytochrome P450